MPVALSSFTHFSQAIPNTEGKIQYLGVCGHCASPEFNLQSDPLALEMSTGGGQEIGFPDPPSLPA